MKNKWVKVFGVMIALSLLLTAGAWFFMNNSWVSGTSKKVASQIGKIMGEP